MGSLSSYNHGLSAGSLDICFHILTTSYRPSILHLIDHQTSRVGPRILSISLPCFLPVIPGELLGHRKAMLLNTSWILHTVSIATRGGKKFAVSSLFVRRWSACETLDSGQRRPSPASVPAIGPMGKCLTIDWAILATEIFSQFCSGYVVRCVWNIIRDSYSTRPVAN